MFARIPTARPLSTPMAAAGCSKAHVAPAAATGGPTRTLVQVVHWPGVQNGATGDRENAMALAVREHVGLRGIGGSDAHSEHGLGCCATVFERPIRNECELIRGVACRSLSGDQSLATVFSRTFMTSTRLQRTAVMAEHAMARRVTCREYRVEHELFYGPVGDEVEVLCRFSMSPAVLLKGRPVRRARRASWSIWRISSASTLQHASAGEGPTGHNGHPGGLPLITVSCHEDLTASDLVGRYLLQGDETVWIYGPFYTRRPQWGHVLSRRNRRSTQGHDCVDSCANRSSTPTPDRKTWRGARGT